MIVAKQLAIYGGDDYALFNRINFSEKGEETHIPQLRKAASWALDMSLYGLYIGIRGLYGLQPPCGHASRDTVSNLTRHLQPGSTAVSPQRYQSVYPLEIIPRLIRPTYYTWAHKHQ